MRKTISKKILSLFLSVVLLLGCVPAGVITAVADEFSVSGNQIENDYLVFSANDDRFAMHTTGGNPDSSTDDDQRLLYGSIGDGTSRTVIRVNGEDYYYSPETALLNTAGDCIYSVQTIDGVKIERYCSFVQNTETERKDTLEMKYVFTNIDSTANSVGTRIMFDTMLGYNDDAPFRVFEGSRLVDLTSEKEYVGDAIPQRWYVFDSLSSPSVLASGTFYNNEREKPDKVQFILYDSSSNSDFYNSIDGYDFGDSTVNVYYNPTSLASGESRTVKTYYGLSEFTPIEGDETAEIRLTNAIKPQYLIPQEDGRDYQSNPFQFSAWISNTSEAESSEVTATIVLPEELTIDDQDAQISLDTIEAESYQSVGWMIRALPQTVEKEVTYSVIVSCDGEEDQTYDFSIRLPALNTIHEHTVSDEWIIDLEPTCTENGSKHRNCTVCGEIAEREEIPALGHTYDSLEITTPVTSDKVDLAFVIDTTGSMGEDIAEVKQNMTAYLDALIEKGIDYRIAIVDYRDFADRTDDSEDYPYKVDIDFTNNTTAIRNAINSLDLGYGGDDEETVYSALVDGLTSLSWRDDAGKAAIIMADADALDPEPHTGYTFEYVRSVLSGGTAPAGKDRFNTPVAVFAIDSYGSNYHLEDIAVATGGEYYTVSDAPEISTIINNILLTISDTIFIPGSEWVTRSEPTCTEDGERFRTCTRCGYEDVRMIPALGHDFSVFVETVPPTTVEEGYTIYECSRCDETEHRDFTEEIVSPATVIISNEVSKPNKEVVVSFTLTESVPIKSIMLYDFEYDEDILELVEARCMLDDVAIENWDPSSGEAVMSFRENTDANGLVLELVFQVKDVDNCETDISCSVAATYAKPGYPDVRFPVNVVDGSVKVFSGDVNGDGVLNTVDVIYLIKHTLLPDRYPIECDADFNGDGVITSDDAIYLLSHIMFPDRYPLQ